jgi:predicted nucleic acid-binding protein
MKSTQKFVVLERNGMAERASKPLIYIDANPFVYAIEGDDASAAPIKRLFEWLRERPGSAVSSELTLAEVPPKALPNAQRGYFHLIIWSGIFDLQPVTRGILLETARYRRGSTKILPDGRESMAKLPDAIHMVTAIRSGCQKILSKDAGLRLPIGYERVEPDDKGIGELITELERP